jgi:hypothetical protein
LQDHILHTLASEYCSGDPAMAVSVSERLVRGASAQHEEQQAAFLDQYLRFVLQSARLPGAVLPRFPVPIVVTEATAVTYGLAPMTSSTADMGPTISTGIFGLNFRFFLISKNSLKKFSKSLIIMYFQLFLRKFFGICFAFLLLSINFFLAIDSSSQWNDLERTASTVLDSRLSPPTHRFRHLPLIADASTDNTKPRHTPCGEPFRIQLQLRNPMLIPLRMTRVRLG